MTVYKTEEEQVEDIKRWAKAYGPSIIIGILIALAVMYGWRFWQAHETKRAVRASLIYQAMLDATSNEQPKSATQAANRLITTYPRTPYAQYARLLLAKMAIADNNYFTAKQYLKWVAKHGYNKSIRQIAQLRLARIALQQKNPNAALQYLDYTLDNVYKGLIAEIKGEAYEMEGQSKLALEQYNIALTNIPNVDKVMPGLRLKVTQLQSLA
ncbi:MAG: YfgM family protein [Gammaproteobacteria bacterium]